MLYATLKTLHVLAVVGWVGGMAFAHFFLRPAVASLPPPERLRLMHEVLRRFLGAVGALVVVVLASGFGMAAVGLGAAGAAVGATAKWPPDWIAMTVLGLVMAAVYVFIRFVPFVRLARSLEGGDLPAAAAALAQVRGWVLVNLGLGLTIVVVVLMV